MAVRVIAYHERKREDGTVFYVLTLQGKPSIVTSQSTGKQYFTAPRVSIPANLDEESCKDLIGERFVGSIKKVECEPYEFSVPSTGEIIKLNFRYEYSTEGDSIEETIMQTV